MIQKRTSGRWHGDVGQRGGHRRVPRRVADLADRAPHCRSCRGGRAPDGGRLPRRAAGLEPHAGRRRVGGPGVAGRARRARGRRGRAAGLSRGDQPHAGAGTGERDRRLQHRPGHHAVRLTRAAGAVPRSRCCGATRSGPRACPSPTPARTSPRCAPPRSQDGDDFVINGQKTWNSLGHYADWCQLYVRTDPTAKKHAGITCFLVDLRTPGIEARPLTTMTGDQTFAELFFTDARVPRTAMLGPLHGGWGGGHDDARPRAGRRGASAPVAGPPAR